MRVTRRPHNASSRSSDNARWLPRLFGASACASSTMTVRTVDSMRRPDSEPSRMYSDSGVVTTMCGGRLRILSRSACGVSPVRTIVRISTSGSQSCRSSSRMPAIGTSRLMRTSFESAFSGETYTTAVSSGSGCSTPRRTRSSIAARNAASVLPEPVGAAISVLRPERIAGHASACAGVGAANVRRNQLATAGWKVSSGMVVFCARASQILKLQAESSNMRSPR